MAKIQFHILTEDQIRRILEEWQPPLVADYGEMLLGKWTPPEPYEACRICKGNGCSRCGYSGYLESSQKTRS